jgi:hypothetical protein
VASPAEEEALQSADFWEQEPGREFPLHAADNKSLFRVDH